MIFFFSNDSVGRVGGRATATTEKISELGKPYLNHSVSIKQGFRCKKPEPVLQFPSETNEVESLITSPFELHFKLYK